MRPIIPSKKQNSGQKIFFIFTLFLILLLSTSSSSFNAVSSFFNAAAVPFWNTADSLSGDMPVFRTRAALEKENEDLQQKIDVLTRNLKGYDVVVQENLEFKKLFAGKKSGGVFAGILARPGHLPFDILLLDIGSEAGIGNGDLVLGDQNIALGNIIETYPYSAKIQAFSSSGEVTDAFLGPENIPVKMKGMGGGSFTAELPRELDVQKGDAAMLPGSDGFILAYVESKEENLTDSFQRLYLRTPVNVFELKYAQIIPHSSINEQ